MVIPQYDLVTRRKLPPVFPPVMSVERIPVRFDQSYVGTKIIRQRVFRALLSFAAGQISFWQFSFAIAAVGSLGIAISSKGMPGGYVAVTVSIVVIGAFIMPLRLAAGVGRAADSYAIDGEMYSSIIGEETVLWQTPKDTYEVPWELVDQAVSKGDVTILTLKSSRAICVLPNELFSPGTRSQLDHLDHRRRELS